MEYDSEEEWIIDSIKKYKELIMFDTGDSIEQIELGDIATVYLLCERKTGIKTISILSLPTKMTQMYLGEILLSNDLKIKSGIFPSSPPCRILAVYGENRLLTTQNGDEGLMVYNIKSSDTGEVSYNTTLKFPILNPQITLINQSTIVLTKDTQQRSLIGDLNTSKILADYVFDNSRSSDLVPVCLNENVLAFSEKMSGTSYVCDWRSHEVIAKINAEEKSDTAVFPASTYLPHQKSNITNNLYFLSQSGIFKFYDLRFITNPVMKHDLKLSTSSGSLKLCFNPKNSNIVSISGFDNNVYLFDVSKDMANVFQHEGHSRTEECGKDTIVTDHLWYPNDFIISGASNNSFNCWIHEV